MKQLRKIIKQNTKVLLQARTQDFFFGGGATNTNKHYMLWKLSTYYINKANIKVTNIKTK
jgi:hypothetical protein